MMCRKGCRRLCKQWETIDKLLEEKTAFSKPVYPSAGAFSYQSRPVDLGKIASSCFLAVKLVQLKKALRNC